MSAQIKGWCPSAHRPMMSGDGLLVRIKPRKARFTAQAMQSLCALAQSFGNGMIDVTSRANLQIRGVTETNYPKLLDRLITAGLVDADPSQEAARAITVNPFWRPDDLTDRLATAFQAMSFPVLPDKMGVVIDTGPAPMLSETSGDFRFETSGEGDLILRADGATCGRVIEEANASTALMEMIEWFLETDGAKTGRMGRHLRTVALPADWRTTLPRPSADRPDPGNAPGGCIFGVPFGQADAASLAELLSKTKASNVRVTPWRMLFLEEAKMADVRGFLSDSDPLLDVFACPGAPACAQATVGTRDLARLIAPKVHGVLHVSGCTKGCARRAPAAITLVGREGRFDLVQDGAPGDTPVKEGLDQAEILELLS